MGMFMMNLFDNSAMPIPYDLFSSKNVPIALPQDLFQLSSSQFLWITLLATLTIDVKSLIFKNFLQLPTNVATIIYVQNQLLRGFMVWQHVFMTSK
ncbi:MAG TPA: hypothetical protein VNW52_02955 [Burkholderiaceae bacterium]|jgi:hypothetical protein|nr:hypothetical protein [Burkholderiaceae bacterium]